MMELNVSPLLNIILNQLETKDNQRLTFAEYMELVLYHHQYGYYGSDPNPIGKQGDFLTSPHLVKDFGELLAIQFQQMWEIFDFPSQFILLEMGAGHGLIARDILNYCQVNFPEFFKAINYMIIEKSSLMIQRQKEILSQLPVSWCNWSDIDDHSLIGCIFSNELVDALPVHQVIVKDGKLWEIYVSWDREKQQFIEIIDRLSTESINDYFHLSNINLLNGNYANGYRTEVNLAAIDWLKTVNQKLKQGYLLTIDYGYSSNRYYHAGRNEGTLQCYYQHNHHNNPYIYIGQQDLTAHVNFTALENYGKILGLTNLHFNKQGLFLMALGLGDRLANITQSNLPINQLLQRRQHLHQLIDPMGLGNFGVLLQGKNLNDRQSNQPLKGFTTI